MQKRAGWLDVRRDRDERIRESDQHRDAAHRPRRGGAPAGQGAPPAAPPAVQSEKLADGVYRITGGYVALAVEMKDHVIVLEGGQNEARGLAVIAETKRVLPNKPIKYVVNTHSHFDHASGLAPFVAEGITIVTHQNNQKFLDEGARRAAHARRGYAGEGEQETQGRRGW